MTKVCDDVNRCAISLPCELLFRQRRSTASLRAMEELEEPSGHTCSPPVVYNARSNCSAAIKDEDTMAMSSSRSLVIGLSDLSMRESRTLCRNMGNSGGESVPRGVARTKTARGLTASTVIPALTDRLSSNQRV